MMLTDDAPGNTDYLINQLRSWNRAQNDDVMLLIYGIGKSTCVQNIMLYLPF